MYTLPEASLSFLRDLSDHNTKEWFHDNRKRYERELKGPARALAEAINEGLAAIAPDYVTPPNKALSRINRDIRFSKDKTPYNTHIWAAYVKQGVPKYESPGFYFAVRLDGVGIGGGAYMPPRDQQQSLRALIADAHPELTRILATCPSTATCAARPTSACPSPSPPTTPPRTGSSSRACTSCASSAPSSPPRPTSCPPCSASSAA